MLNVLSRTAPRRRVSAHPREDTNGTAITRAEERARGQRGNLSFVDDVSPLGLPVRNAGLGLKGRTLLSPFEYVSTNVRWHMYPLIIINLACRALFYAPILAFEMFLQFFV